MNFDLIVYAKEHRYRVRNLHDGQGVPPTRRRGVRRSGGFVGERHDAIICRDGYMDVFGPGKIGWCVLLKSSQQLTWRLKEIVAAGGVVTQEGDTEAAGWGPAGRTEEILKALRVYHRQTARDNSALQAPRATRLDCHPRW